MLISQGIHPLRGVKQVRGNESTLFSSKMRQYHSPDGADCCCIITSNKSLTCLQLVFTSKWCNFRHAFASRGFVSVSWAFLLNNVGFCFMSSALQVQLCTVLTDRRDLCLALLSSLSSGWACWFLGQAVYDVTTTCRRRDCVRSKQRRVQSTPSFTASSAAWSTQQRPLRH